MWRHYNWLWYQIRISCMIYINCTWQDNASYCSCCAMIFLLYPYALHFDTPSIIRSCLVSEVAPKEQTTNIDFLILHYIQYKTKQLCALIYWFALHFEFVQVSESMCRKKAAYRQFHCRVFFLLHWCPVRIISLSLCWRNWPRRRKQIPQSRANKVLVPVIDSRF